jgi:hypothetical protein
MSAPLFQGIPKLDDMGGSVWDKGGVTIRPGSERRLVTRGAAV